MLGGFVSPLRVFTLDNVIILEPFLKVIRRKPTASLTFYLFCHCSLSSAVASAVSSYVLSLHIGIHCKTAYFGCGITLQPLAVVEASAEAVVLGLAVEVGNRYSVVGQTEKRHDAVRRGFLKHCVSDGQLFLSVKRRVGQDKAVGQASSP